MVEEPQSEISKTLEIKDDEPVVQRNLRLLERAYIPNTPKLFDKDEEEIGRYFLSGGERMMEDENTMLTAIKIRYVTETGNISKTPNWKDGGIRDGEYSIFRTHLVSEGEKVEQLSDKSGWVVIPGKYKILLIDPEGWLSTHALSAAVDQQFGSGTGEDPLAAEGRWRLPERIIPSLLVEYGSNIMGRTEPWGKSELVEDAKGDLYLFKAIELFNSKHGPSLKEQLFRQSK